MFGLCSLAVAGPLLAVLGPLPMFFSAHAAGRPAIVLFTLALLLVPTLAVLAFVVILRALDAAIARHAIAVCVGGLIALAVVPQTKQVIELRARWYVGITVIITILLAVVYNRNERFRSLLPWTALAGLAIAASFLFFSPIAAYVLPAQSTVKDQAAGKSNVVFVLLDELPLAALLDEKAEVNAKRFPGFGELARRSTWYRNATTVAPWTYLAGPGILSGSLPKPSGAPTPADYPRNVFSVLRSTHNLRAIEGGTDFCVAAECDYGPKDRLALYRDALVVYSHIVKPKHWKPSWLPQLYAQWANFGRADVREESLLFERFNRGLAAAPDGRPTLWYGHFLLPHLPLLYLPDGRTYGAGLETHGLTPDQSTWTGNRPLMNVSRQRFLLQLKYTDSLIAQTIENLESRGLFDDTMLVVAADHGLVFQTGNRRGVPLTKAGLPELLPVPLFIKYPGQSKASVDRRPAELIDIMPTIADVLRVTPSNSNAYDGSSLIGKHVRRRRTYVEPGEGYTLRRLHPPSTIDLKPAIRSYLELFGSWESTNDVYAWGPYRELLGTKLGSTERRASSPSVTLLSGRIAEHDPKAPSAPALVQVAFDRKLGTDWFAVTINGVVAGLGRTYGDGGQNRGLAMLNPSYFSRWRNEIGVALLRGDGKFRAVRMS